MLMTWRSRCSLIREKEQPSGGQKTRSLATRKPNLKVAFGAVCVTGELARTQSADHGLLNSLQPGESGRAVAGGLRLAKSECRAGGSWALRWVGGQGSEACLSPKRA